MIGDKIIPTVESRRKASDIWQEMPDKFKKPNGYKYIITIDGVSGTQKSEIARDLRDYFHNENVRCIIVHTDNYYFVKPMNRKKWREDNFDKVGSQEYNWKALKNLAINFKHSQISEITVLLYDIHLEAKGKPPPDPQKLLMSKRFIDIMIIEGLYAGDPILPSDWRIHLNGNIETTQFFRKMRMKENENDPFRIKVLEKEQIDVNKLIEFSDIRI